MNSPRRASPTLYVAILTCLACLVAVVVFAGGLLQTVAPAQRAIGQVLAGAVAAAALGAWLANRITGSLRRLTRTAHAYAEGDLHAQGRVAPAMQEVRELSEALDIMARTLRARIGELTTERNQATAILESMAEGVVALDAQGRILLMNPSAKILLGLTAVGSIGQRLAEVLRHQEAQTLMQAVLDSRERITKEIGLFQPNERVLRLHAAPCRGAAPKGPCAVVVIQDVTESHRYEQLRKEFVANVSHELKSPLTSIRSLAETLLGGALEDPSTNRRFVRLIDEDAARLSRLIDDLLALSQIESQAVPLRLAVVELRPMAESVLASLKVPLKQRQIGATCELPEDLTVRADPDRLRQVLVNLVENAIKYNKESGTLTLSAVAEGGWVKVAVADTGIGIPPQDLPRVFERFYRVDKARSRELGGTGLGLAIVKHIVEAHGGSVSVESEPNRGSTFSFTVPLAS